VALLVRRLALRQFGAARPAPLQAGPGPSVIWRYMAFRLVNRLSAHQWK
jgi:hypothetical protein